MTLRIKKVPAALCLVIAILGSFIGPATGTLALSPASSLASTGPDAFLSAAAAVQSPAAQTRLRPLDTTPGDPSGQCNWIIDCSFSTFQSGQPSGIWYPNQGGDTGVSASGGDLTLPYVSGVQENVNFGPYDPQSTYSYTLTFEAESVKTCSTCDASAQLYVGFEQDECSYNWFTLPADKGWQSLSVTGTYNPNSNPPIVTNPSGAANQPGPPPVVCFLNEYGDHATDHVENISLAIAQNGHLIYRGPLTAEIGPGSNPSENNICSCTRTHTSNPVNSATGDFFHTFTDLSIPGRGIPLQFTRTYNSVFVNQDSPVGYGWSENDDAFLTTDSTGVVTVTQENGTIAVFMPTATGGYEAAGRVLATLISNRDGTDTLTRKDQTQLQFTDPSPTSVGQLVAESDRNGYTTHFSYTGNQLTQMTDSAGRSLFFTYTGTHIRTITDPIGRTVVFTYDVSGNLTAAQDIGGSITQFTYYPGTHLLHTMTDPRGGTVSNVYDNTGRVLSQTDALQRTTNFTYTVNPDLSQTTIITQPNGTMTAETYQNAMLASVTKGFDSTQAATWTYTYDPNTLGVASETDPDNHTSYSTYDATGNLLASTDPLSRTTTYAYDSLNDTIAITDPMGVETVMTYDANGNLLSTSRPLTTTSTSATTAMIQTGVQRPTAPNMTTMVRQVDVGDGSLALATATAVTDTMATTGQTPPSCTAPTTTPAPPSTSWQAVASLPVPLGRPATALGCDGNVYVFGGFTTTNVVNTTYIYSPTANTWTQGAPLPLAREGAQAVTLPDGRIAVLGGGVSATGTGCQTNVCSDGTVYNEVDVYTPATNSWSTLAPMISPRYRFDAVLLGGSMYAIGGANGTQVISSTEVYSPTTNAWTPGPALPQPLMSPGAAVDGTGTVDLAGGWTGTGNTLAALLMLKNGAWQSGPSLTQATEDEGAALGRDGHVYVAGGFQAGFGWLSAVQSYDPIQGQWTSAPSLPSPISEEGLVALPDGRLIAIGGYTVDHPIAQVAVYAPPLATSTPTPTTDPSATPTNTPSATPTASATTTPTTPPSTLCQQAGPYTATVCLTYDPAHPGDVLTQTDPDGHTTHYTYDEFGDRTSVTDPMGDETTYAYDTVGRTIAMVTPRGNVSGANPISYTTTYTYNAFGDTTAITDGLGHVTTYQYDADQNLITTTDALGHQTITGYDLDNERTSVRKADGGLWLTGYDGDGNVITQTDPLSHSTVYGYDALDRVITTTDPLSGTTLTGYDPAGNVITSTDPMSHTTVYGYDAANERISDLRPDGGIWRTGYDLDGRVITTTDGLQNQTVYTYDSLDRRTGVTDPLQRTTLTAYDLAGNVISTTDPLSRITLNYYDQANRLITVRRPDLSMIRTGYDADSNVISTTDPLSHTTLTAFDVLDRPITTTDPLSHTTVYGYDAIGDRTSVTDGNNHTTTYGYDPLSRVITTTDPLGHATLESYDLAGNVISTTDALSHTTINGYDAANEQTSVQQPDGSVLRTGYDLVGNVITTTDALGRLTSYGYDPVNQVISMTNPLTETTVYTYDLDGNQTALIDAMGRTTRYGYDADNEPVTTTYSDGTTPDVAWTYYKSGQRATMTDGTGTTNYQYDLLDRPITVTTGAGQMLGYQYDLAGNLTNLIYPDGTVITRTYDAANRWTGVIDPFGKTLSFGYDPANNLTMERYPSAASLTSTLTYNKADQLTRIHDATPKGTLWTFTYTRDNDGQVSGGSDPVSGQTHTYGYSLLNQLTTDHQSSGTTTTALRYTPNSADDITRIVNGSGAYTSTATYDLGHELTRVQLTGSQVGTTTYGYNPDGDRTSATASGHGTSSSYGYDQADRLTTATVGSTHASYVYNGDGLRQSKTVSGTTTLETWDTAEGLPLMASDGNTTYVTGPDGLPLEVISGKAVQYLLHDQLGSTRGIFSSAGTLIGTATYDPYGNVTAHRGATTPFGYAGQYTDVETGFQDLRARYYDSTTSLFLTVDPKVDETKHPYTYADTNPVNAVDPWGMSCNGASGSGVGRVFSAIGDLFCNAGEVKDTLLTGQANGTTTAMVNEATSLVTFEPTVAGGPGSACGDAAAYYAQAERDQQQLDTEARNASIFAIAMGVPGAVRGVVGAIGRASNTGRTVWDLNPFARGRSIESTILGRPANIPVSNFPVIDDFENGVATSIKSLDLTTPTYQNTSSLTSKLSQYASKLSGYQGGTWGGVDVPASSITQRNLVIAFPSGAATSAQEQALNQFAQLAAQRWPNVHVIYRFVP